MIIFLLIIKVADVTALINPYGPTVVSEFTNCVSELIDLNFKDPGLVIFADTKNVSTSVARIRTELLKKINGNTKYSVEVKSPNNGTSICNQNNIDDKDIGVINRVFSEPIMIANYIILVIDTYQDFTYIASRLISSRSWNPHARFIILFFNIQAPDKINVAHVEKILSCLFKHNVINIVVAVPQAKNLRNVIIYGWRPFDPPKYCGYYNETAGNRLLIENKCERGVVKIKKDIFEGRVPNDMNGCVLYALALERQPFVSDDPEDPNIEKLFINEVAGRYNFKINYEVIGTIRGEKDESENWDGALRELVAKKGQILVGGMFPDVNVHEDFECSLPYLADSYTWVVPLAFPRAPFVALIIIFQEFVWYSVIAGFFLCTLSWRILGQFSGETVYHRSLDHCFLNTWISSVGFCAYARPVKHALRVFYVFFNLYCILFLTAYQTKLIDYLTNPTFEEQVDTIEELVDSGLQFGGFEELHGLFLNSSDTFDYLIGEKWVDVDNITKAFIDVAVHRNFSLLCSRLELAHMSAIMPELSDSSGKFKYFAFDRNTFTVPMEMVALRGFAFTGVFSKIIEYFKQLGINEGIRRHFAALNSRKRAKLLQTIKGDQPDMDPLSLQHLQGGFLALMLGFVGGTLVLFMEILTASKHMTIKYSNLKQFVLNSKYFK